MTKLTDSKIKAAKPRDKKYRLADGGGLAIIVNPGGSKMWLGCFRLDKAAKEMTLGTYPATGLKDVRQRVVEQRGLLLADIDPQFAAMREEVKERSALSDTTFAGVARAWLDRERERWAEKTFARARHRIEKDAIPLLGSVQIANITAPDIKAVKGPVELLVAQNPNWGRWS
ncbi:integrase arm-type DNA-binding domain-containing protein [Ruegeria sp. Alg231-54]|uniref:tyrosine-type recombinase/integrase n=1 Tax=Ruegeria sp. Alg231-54 TaxID=1922221 RepID=UPI000D5513DC|nr:integrase arm-type DNA-binding domain-containing protein [Ruegeria sp. Alg231-54]